MYTLIIYLYILCAKILAFFNPKVRLMIRGHRDTWHRLRKVINGQPHVWFHAASLGEFEQGRPLMEALRQRQPGVKILLTFFSPSGYEVRKDYAGADVVCYLPFDTPLNARHFVRLACPSQVFLIKYEFWRNYVDVLHAQGIPIYSVSSIFRPKQIFFRWYGYKYARVLRRMTRLFVQNEASQALLHTQLGLTNTMVVGDTRFDRVLSIKQAAKPLPLIASFAAKAFTIAAGSSWPVDEDFIIDYMNTHPQTRLILAPHVVSEEHLSAIEARLQVCTVRYSALTAENVAQVRCVLIDGYGLLSSLYAYAQVAYIGGGFGVGIHNVTEAAVYGIPVLIGPNYHKFAEACTLVALGGAHVVQTAVDYGRYLDSYHADTVLCKSDGEIAGHYIADSAGATERIYEAIYTVNQRRN